MLSLSLNAAWKGRTSRSCIPMKPTCPFSCKPTGVLILALETGKLPDHMGKMARYISGKCGGLGEVAVVLCEGLTRVPAIKEEEIKKTQIQ
jgi:hypothetical protein